LTCHYGGGGGDDDFSTVCALCIDGLTKWKQKHPNIASIARRRAGDRASVF